MKINCSLFFVVGFFYTHLEASVEKNQLSAGVSDIVYTGYRAIPGPIPPIERFPTTQRPITFNFAGN